MNKHILQRIDFLLILLLITQSPSMAQLSAEDSVFFQKAKDNTVSQYQQQLGGQSGLINGSQYLGYPFNFTEGHPFFYNDTVNSGSIVYDKVAYQHIQLQYDEISDVVICAQTYRSVQLLSEKIARFSILNHQFTRIINDSLKPSIPNTGFYELIYEGQTTVLKKESKKIQEDLRVQGMEILRTIITKTNYFIKKDNVYFPVKNKTSLLNVYKDKEQEIDRYLKKSKLKYKKNSENMILKTAAYYDQLHK
jgi:hypothetical protein